MIHILWSLRTTKVRPLHSDWDWQKKPGSLLWKEDLLHRFLASNWSLARPAKNVGRKPKKERKRILYPSTPTDVILFYIFFSIQGKKSFNSAPNQSDVCPPFSKNRGWKDDGSPAIFSLSPYKQYSLLMCSTFRVICRAHLYRRCQMGRRFDMRHFFPRKQKHQNLFLLTNLVKKRSIYGRRIMNRLRYE